MSARRNPPSFVVIDAVHGVVVYTHHAAGVGTEAINKCVAKAKLLANKRGRPHIVFLDIRGLRVGMQVNVGMVRALGITEEIFPQESAMPSGRKCCSAPDPKPSGQGVRCFNCQRWESDNYLKNPRGRKRTKPIVGRPDALPWERLSDVEQAEIAHQYEGRGADIMKLIARGARFIKRYGGWEYRLNNPRPHVCDARCAHGCIVKHELRRRPSGERPKYCPDCGAKYIGTVDMHRYECSARGGGSGKNMYWNNPRRVRKNIFTFNNPYGSIEGADKDAARELELYIENDSQLYHSQFIPIVKNLMLKRRKGIFNPQLAAKLFLYLVEAGAKKYCKEFGGVWHQMFSMPTRQLVANHFVFSFSAEADLGNYDRLIGGKGSRIIENPRPLRKGEATIKCACGEIVSLDEPDASGTVDCLKCGQLYNSFGQKLKDPSEWSGARDYEDTLDNSRRRGVRKNIFTFNNPRKLNAMEQAAASVGLYVTTWAPGDGKTRYRFHQGPADYHDGSGIYTAVGRADAMKFIQSYGMGRGRKNPLNRSEIAQVINMTKDVARTARRAKELGDTSRMKANLAYGRGMLDVSMTFGKRGTSRGVRGMLERYNKIESRESSRSNPVCSNPVIRGDKLPAHLKAEVLRTFIYRWTTGNTQRDSAWAGISGKPRIPLISDEQWLREHAFHVTKAGKLDARHHHAEPYYMADDWKKGDPRPNPDVVQVEVESTRHYKVGRELLAEVAPLQRSNHISVYVRTTSGPVRWMKDFNGTSMTSINAALRYANKLAATYGVKVVDNVGRVLPNPLLQTVLMANPPISSQWARLTERQRLELLEIVGYEGGYMTRRPWAQLPPSVQNDLERQWYDTSAPRRGGTTRRRRAVAVNPLTRKESAQVLRRAKYDVRLGSAFRPGHTRSERAGQAHARAQVVRAHGPKSAGRAAMKIADRAQQMAGTVISNPGIKFPKPGTKMTVAQAMKLAQQVGDKELIRQCQEAAKLQSKANRGTKCVIWKTLPIGSPNRIDMVTAFAHYGDSPETMYRPPKGSKKGPHMYRHKWGEGSGTRKSVPILAAPSGKALITLMGPGQKTGDWMRG